MPGVLGGGVMPTWGEVRFDRFNLSYEQRVVYTSAVTGLNRYQATTE